MVNDQLRRTVFWGELKLDLNATPAKMAIGVPCWNVVVLGKALVVINREGVHFTGLLEDTCPDVTVVDVNLSFVRFLQKKVDSEGVLGVHEFGVRVLGELS